jgi:hypothetical protein
MGAFAPFRELDMASVVLGLYPEYRIVDVGSGLEFLHRVDVGRVAEVSALHVIFVFSVYVIRVNVHIFT